MFCSKKHSACLHTTRKYNIRIFHKNVTFSMFCTFLGNFLTTGSNAACKATSELLEMLVLHLGILRYELLSYYWTKSQGRNQQPVQWPTFSSSSLLEGLIMFNPMGADPVELDKAQKPKKAQKRKKRPETNYGIP